MTAHPEVIRAILRQREPEVRLWEMSPSTACWRLRPSPDHPPRVLAATPGAGGLWTLKSWMTAHPEVIRAILRQREPEVRLWEMSPSTECWRLRPSPDHPPGAGAVASEVEPTQNQADTQAALD